MTEVIVAESPIFQEMVAMYKDIVRINKELGDENKRLREKKLLTSEEVAEMTSYNAKTIRLKKHEIGFFTVGKEVLFKPDAVDAWIDRNYIKPRFQSGYRR